MSINSNILIDFATSGVTTLETRTIEPHEFDAYRVMMSHGFSFTVKAVDPKARQRGKSSPDLLMNNDRWELKCPSGSNIKKTINRNLNKAIVQMRKALPPAKEIKIVLSCLRTPLSRETILHNVEKKMSEGEIAELLLIVNEYEIRRYTRR